ncbi:MAG: hypothetical protein IIB03_04555 [Acidobacteria bacterium]|nr:hypothetical protein [Acidobacteriota bacterium]
MKRRVVFINFCMLMGISFMAMRFISAWESFEEGYSLEQIVNRTEGRDVGPLDVEPMSPSPPFSDFIVISERNLFSEDRRPPAVEQVEPAKEEIPQEQPPQWAIRPTLHGIVSVGGRKHAFLTVSESNRTIMRTVQLGDLVQGYTVVEIENTLVTLRWKNREEVIDMADAQGAKPATAPKNATAAVTVITVGSAPAAVQQASGKADGQPQGTGIQVSVVSGPASPAASAQAGRTQNQVGQAGSASAGRRGVQPRR